MIRGFRYMLVGYFIVTSLVLSTPLAAQVSVPKSPNYQFDETAIGSGGMLQSSSANFRMTDAIGDIAVGESASANYRILAGSETSPDPRLSFVVNQATPFDTFSPSTTATSTATFSVLNYTSYGYVVQIYGQPPAHNGHVLRGMDITGPSQPGIEQFGMNLVANTEPRSFGANPDNGTFGFGSLDNTEYNAANRFRYISGETIAQAPKESGITNYTISYIANVTGLTPGGTYTSGLSLIVTGTY